MLKIHIGRIKTQADKDKGLSLFICVYLLMNAVNFMIQDAFEVSNNVLMLARLGIIVVIFAFLIMPLLSFTKQEWSILILLEVVVLSAYGYSWLIGVSATQLLDWIGTTMGECVLLGVSAYIIQDKSILFLWIRRFTWPIWIVLAIDIFYQVGGIYEMHFSYAILLVILVHLNELINGGNMIYLVSSSIQIIMLLSYGSRGAVICIMVFLVLKIFTNIQSYVKKFLYIFSLFLSGLFINNIALRLGKIIYGFLVTRGMGGRTLRLLLKGRFILYNNRSQLWATVINCIKEKPLAGWGIRGAVYEMGHPYPHQFFLDFPLTFGLPLGLFLIAILVWPLRKVITTKEGFCKDIIQIFFCVGFVSLMISGTVFTSYYYFLLMGLVLSADKDISKTHAEKRNMI